MNYGVTQGTVAHGQTYITVGMVRDQLAKAQAGKGAKSPMAAVPRGEQNRARIGATSTGQAALKSAYWLAVLSRVTGDRQLIPVAGSFLSRGGGQDRTNAAIAAVYVDALRYIGPQHGKWGRYVAATLGSILTQTDNARRIEADQGGFVNRLLASSDTVGGYLPTPKKAKRVGNAVVFGIVGGGLLLTYLLWVRPLVKARRRART